MFDQRAAFLKRALIDRFFRPENRKRWGSDRMSAIA
jgi:hypothetical protein